MSLKVRILKDMRKAAKEGDQHKRRVARMLLSEISYAETTVQSDQEIDEKTAQSMIRRYYERLRKTLELQPEGEKCLELIKSLQTVALYLPESDQLQQADPENPADYTGPFCQAL